MAEDLLLLLLRKSTGVLPRRMGTQGTLAVALLLELTSLERLEIDDDLVVRVVNETPVSHDLLGNVLVAVRGIAPAPLDAVIAMLTPRLYPTLLDRLTERGIMARSDRRVTLGLRSKTVWHMIDTTRRKDVQNWLAGVVFGHVAPDTHSCHLLALLSGMDRLDEIIGDSKQPAAWQLADALAAPSWAIAAARKALFVAMRTRTQALVEGD